MAEKMKPTATIAFISLGIGIVVSIVTGMLAPHLIWWGYPLVAILVAGFLYGIIIDQIAKERLVDRDHQPK